jgi:hypothetical protein
MVTLWGSSLASVLTELSESESYVTTDGQSASLSWNKAPFWGLRPDLNYCLTVAGLLIWGALSDCQSHIATDGQSVSKSWCRAPPGAHGQILITLWQLRSCFVGCPLWPEDGSVFCICCWPLPAQSFLGPSPLGLETIFYCLRFETSLFIASYDSQGHGGGIQLRLHTGLSLSDCLSGNCLMYSTVGSYREHLALWFVAVCTGNVSIVSLHW